MYRLELELTKDCNLACDYCFQTHPHDVMEESLGKRSIDFAIQKALSLGKKEWKILFFGGEPLLQFDTLRSLTKYALIKAKEAGLKTYFDMTTNGTLFNLEVASFCAEHNFRVKISLDGTPEDHNRHRKDRGGRGSYELIMRNVDAINLYQQKTQRPVQISMVVNPNTAANIRNNLEHIVSKGFGYIDLCLNRLANWQIEELTVIERELRKCAELYIECAREGKPFNWTLFDQGIQSYVCPGTDYFCGAGVSYMFVTTDGSIYPCSGSLKEAVKIGEVSQGFWEERIQRYSNYQRNLSIKCSNCDINKHCSTCDCIIMNLELTGDFYQVSDLLCQFTKIKHRIAREIADEFDREKIVDYRKFFMR